MATTSTRSGAPSMKANAISSHPGDMNRSKISIANLRTNLLNMPREKYFVAVRHFVQSLEVELNLLGPKTSSQELTLEEIDKCARIMFSASLIQQIDKVLHHRAEQLDSLTLDSSFRRETNTLLIFCEHAFEHVSIKAALRLVQSLLDANDDESKKNVQNIIQMSGNAFQITSDDSSIQLKVGNGACAASQNLVDHIKYLCQPTSISFEEPKAAASASRRTQGGRQGPAESSLGDSIPETAQFMPNQLFSPFSESSKAVPRVIKAATATDSQAPLPQKIKSTPREYKSSSFEDMDTSVSKKEADKLKAAPAKLTGASKRIPAAPTVSSTTSQSKSKRNGDGDDEEYHNASDDGDEHAQHEYKTRSAARTRPAKRSRDDSKKEAVSAIEVSSRDEESSLFAGEIEELLDTADPQRVAEIKKSINRRPASIRSILEGPGEAHDIRERIAVLAAIQQWYDENPQVKPTASLQIDIGRLENQVLYSHQKAKKQKL